MMERTLIRDANSRVRREREAVDAKLDALDRFVERVEALSSAPTPSDASATTDAAGTVSRSGESSGEGCRGVRRAFAETVRPHSVADVDDREPLRETIGAELSESVALALADATTTRFTSKLKGAVVSAASARRGETATTRRALDREADALGSARAVVDETREWIATADETPLRDLGFDALRRRHERLGAHRARCEDVLDRRQSFLDGATRDGPEVAVDHRTLVRYLYDSLPVDHPVLATVARLDETCRACQRAVREHLVRRA